MAFTAQLGVADSKPGNIELGLGGVIPPHAKTTPATLVVEVAFDADPVTTSGYYYNDLNDGPIGYWRMDSQTSLTDQTGAGNTMTVENTPTLVTTLIPGDGNQATEFNGTTQGAYAVSTAGLSPTTAMSEELWIKTPGSLPGSTKDLSGKRGSWRIQWNSSGKLVFSLKGGVYAPTLTSNATLSTSTTYHVAVVYDGARIYIYLNGLLDTSTGYSGGIDANQSRLRIASLDDSSASPAWRAGTYRAGENGLTANKPVGTTDGDYLLAWVFTHETSTVNPPAGWTLIALSATGGIGRIYCYGKVAASEPASWAWNQTNDQYPNVSIMVLVGAYTGVSAVTPYCASATTTPLWYSATISPTIRPSYNNNLITGVFGNWYQGSQSWTESGSVTERIDYSPGGFGMALWDKAQTTGADLTITGTFTSSGFAMLNALMVELVGTLTATYTAVTVDEVSVFGYALTAAQVLNHYQQATVPPPTTTWTDITSDVKSVTISRGRQYELNRIEAGTASLALNDDQRRYDPANTSSIYAPNVIPMRQIRIRALLDAVYYPLFQGYVERWESVWDATWGNHAECQITAVDGFEPLSLVAGSGDVQSTLAGTTIANLLGKANWPTANRTLDAGAFTTAAFTLSGSILDAIQQVAEGEAGLFFINASGVAVFHDKNHRTTNTLSTVSQGLFGDQTLLALPYTALKPSKDKDHIVNDWTVTDSAAGAHQVQSLSSQGRYFHRSASRSSYLAAADADTMAAYLLSLTAEPGYRFDEIELTPATNLPLWIQALTREISDRVTVMRQPVGIVPGTTITQDCWIERVEWTISPSEPWRVRWQLSPTDSQVVGIVVTEGGGGGGSFATFGDFPFGDVPFGGI